MAADVSSLVRVLNRYKDDRTAGNESSTSSLITRDLLGGGGGGGDGAVKNYNECQELDLDMQVPSGWEKRLDLKSGKVYLQRCNTPTSPSSCSDQTNQTVQKLQDLNFPPSPPPPPPSAKALLNLFDETSLELKLVSSSQTQSQLQSQSSSNYQSVCTLDKVKFALERAKKEPNRKRLPSIWNHNNNYNNNINNNSSLSPSYSSSSSSIKDTRELDQEFEENVLVSSSSPIAAGCPVCLCYVLIMKNNPQCPRCHSVVPMPEMKRPRIDLNMSI